MRPLQLCGSINAFPGFNSIAPFWAPSSWRIRLITYSTVWFSSMDSLWPWPWCLASCSPSFTPLLTSSPCSIGWVRSPIRFGEPGCWSRSWNSSPETACEWPLSPRSFSCPWWSCSSLWDVPICSRPSCTIDSWPCDTLRGGIRTRAPCSWNCACPWNKPSNRRESLTGFEPWPTRPLPWCRAWLRLMHPRTESVCVTIPTACFNIL